ncbi:hypothetical protein ABH904_001711 [Pseudomonas frederiksbergensis]
MIGINHKGLTVRRQARPGAVAHEQRAAELTFELLHAGGDRGLGDVQLFSRRGQTAVADDFQKGAGEVDVHGQADVGGAGIVRAGAASG